MYNVYSINDCNINQHVHQAIETPIPWVLFKKSQKEDEEDIPTEHHILQKVSNCRLGRTNLASVKFCRRKNPRQRDPQNA